jgi:hypothetical protein
MLLNYFLETSEKFILSFPIRHMRTALRSLPSASNLLITHQPSFHHLKIRKAEDEKFGFGIVVGNKLSLFENKKSRR